MMKRTGKIVISIVIVICLFLAYVQLTYQQQFDVADTGLTASSDSAIIARGKYLVTGPAHCWTCHTPDAGERIQLGPSGGLKGGLKIAFPIGTLYSPNITSDKETGIGSLTDDQLAKAIRYSVRHDKVALLPFMTYNTMTDEDLVAVISYLRSSEPVANSVPVSELNMLGKITYRFILKPVIPEVVHSIRRDTSAVYGKYLAFSVANCRGCHTNRSKFTGEFIGEPFAGGYTMENDHSLFTTPNLTSHQSSPIATWSADAFVQRFRNGAAYEDSPMPWPSFKQMTDDDLKAIYYFLKSLPPVDNRVRSYTSKSQKD